MINRDDRKWFTTEEEVIIKMKATKHFLPEFIAMLKQMEYNGKIGHSSWVAYYADGDGAFRPKFQIKASKDVLETVKTVEAISDEIIADCFDAG